MVLALYERVESRKLNISLDNPSADFAYIAFKSTDENAVRATVEAFLGPFYLAPNGGVLPFSGYQIEHQGNGIWFVTAHYSLKQQRGAATQPTLGGTGGGTGSPPGGGSPLQNPAGTSGGRNSSFNFELGTQSVKLTQSLSTIATFTAAGAGGPDCKGAIGVNGDNVDGVDIDVPVLTFSETHYFPAAFVDEAYVVLLRDIQANPINLAAFRGFAPGEVRFLGAAGALKDESSWEITFRFAVSPNQTNIVVGDITVTSKTGWQYMWVGYKDAVDANVLIKQPAFVKVEKVYGGSFYDGMGIGS